MGTGGWGASYCRSNFRDPPKFPASKRTTIGGRLQKMYAQVVQERLPPKIADLLADWMMVARDGVTRALQEAFPCGANGTGFRRPSTRRRRMPSYGPAISESTPAAKAGISEFQGEDR